MQTSQRTYLDPILNEALELLKKLTDELYYLLKCNRGSANTLGLIIETTVFLKQQGK